MTTPTTVGLTTFRASRGSATKMRQHQQDEHAPSGPTPRHQTCEKAGRLHDAASLGRRRRRRGRAAAATARPEHRARSAANRRSWRRSLSRRNPDGRLTAASAPSYIFVPFLQPPIEGSRRFTSRRSDMTRSLPRISGALVALCLAAASAEGGGRPARRRSVPGALRHRLADRRLQPGRSGRGRGRRQVPGRPGRRRGRGEEAAAGDPLRRRRDLVRRLGRLARRPSPRIWAS